MKALTGIALAVVVLLLVAAGLLLVGLALMAFPLDQVSAFLEDIYESGRTRWALGVAGLGLLVFAVGMVRVTVGKIQRERTIAFQNPDGAVTISLSAIEDFIKRVGRDIPEIKEIKSDVIASKHGVEIKSRVSLWSDVNIPEVTEKIQSLVKTRLQDMLGIEEAIQVRVHVSKIVQPEGRKEKEPSRVAFPGIGYRAD